MPILQKVNSGVKEESEDEEEESEAEEEEERFFVAMVFEKSKVDKLEIPPKCEDPGCEHFGLPLRVKLCNGRDSEEHVVGEVVDKRSKDPRSKIKKGKGLRDTPPRTKKKKKEPVKHTARKRNWEGDSSMEKIEEDKARKKIKLKCASVDDFRLLWAPITSCARLEATRPHGPPAA
ncbi:hypothetical protein PIB30_096222 [Stylosanthes scabra]|uniref:Uncharacterized protein n=1 Tax=Stylosanthes scabra TaxID=79078 RepID=A0ABU6XYF1_9FABA|nr:hypothetical protein [Stylosanthes scabra]